MSDTKISEAAVEAGALALSKYCRGSEVAWQEDRSSFRAALAAALPHLHPQPAELAEQQGEDAVDDQLLDELRDVEDHFNDVDPNPIHLATVQSAIAALAATGRQQVGEVQGDALTLAAEAIDELHEDMTGARIGEEVSRQFAEVALKAALAARQPGDK